MVVQVITTTPSTKTTTTTSTPELAPATSSAKRVATATATTSPSTSASNRSSQPRCITTRSYLPVCQPAMEATKALAQRLRHRASLRRVSKKTAQNGPAESRGRAARSSPGKQQQQQQEAQAARAAPTPESDKEKQSATSSDSPVIAPVLDPPTLAPEASNTSPTVSSTADAPLTPSPGSDLSPCSRPQPELAAGDADSAEAVADAPDGKQATTDYFAIAEPVAPARITFADSTKQDDAEGNAQKQRADSPEDSETAVSSASPPSTVVSPRESVDDGATDAGRSSIASFSGFGSRHSSFNSAIAFRLPNGLLPQGRAKTSQKPRPRDLSPSVSSRYVHRIFLALPRPRRDRHGVSFWLCQIPAKWLLGTTCSQTAVSQPSRTRHVWFRKHEKFECCYISARESQPGGLKVWRRDCQPGLICHSRSDPNRQAPHAVGALRGGIYRTKAPAWMTDSILLGRIGSPTSHFWHSSKARQQLARCDSVPSYLPSLASYPPYLHHHHPASLPTPPPPGGLSPDTRMAIWHKNGGSWPELFIHASACSQV